MDKPKLNFNCETMDEEIRIIVDREARKAPGKMNLDLIIDGLDYLHPFDEREDDLRTKIAWNDFQNRYVAQHNERRSRVKSLRTMIAAAVLMAMILATTICYALGIDLLSIVVNWTKERLNVCITSNAMIDGVKECADAMYNDRVRETWGDEICDELLQMDIIIPLPSWKPDEYVLQRTESTEEQSGQKCLYALYGSEQGKNLVVVVQKYRDADALRKYRLEYEADGNVQEVYKKDDVEFYIMSNLEAHSIMWCSDLCGIFISGDVSYDEIYQIIESVNP